MSFTTNVKQEIAYNDLKPCCAKAELSALIQMCSSLTISNRNLVIVIKTENPTTAKRILKLIKDRYEIETELSVIRKMKLKKNNIYIIKVLNKAMKIIQDLGIYDSKGLQDIPDARIVRKECCARAYLAGAFMASGSCNNPNKSNYHLEFVCITKDHADFIIKLLSRFYIPAKDIERRNKYVVYVKQAEKIGDTLRCIGAEQNVMDFENIRISRDFKNSLTRLDNMDFANEMKTLSASKKQLAYISLIRENNMYDDLDPKLKEVVEIRESYPEHSLIELCTEYLLIYDKPISKSGLKHRFNKIKAIAETLI